MRRILVIDDHRVLADLIVSTLTAESDVECVHSVGDVDAAISSAQSFLPDTIVLDAQLPSGDGVDLIAHLRVLLPTVRIVVLTARPRPDRERIALAAGAVGYLGKGSPLSLLIEAIRSASPEHPARDPELLRGAARAKSVRAISPREREVLSLLADGKHVAEVADALQLSEHTTRDYVKSLLSKFGARSQLEAVAIAAREGLVRVG